MTRSNVKEFSKKTGAQPITCARCGRTIPPGSPWEKTPEHRKVCAEGQCQEKPATLYDRVRAVREEATK